MARKSLIGMLSSWFISAVLAGCGSGPASMPGNDAVPDAPPGIEDAGATTEEISGLGGAATEEVDSVEAASSRAAAGFSTVSAKTISGSTITVTLPRRTLRFSPVRTFYASPSGSDSNPGSATRPWKTVKRALTTLQAGDLLYLRAGNYPPFEVRKSGVSGKPIVISSYPGETARIVQPIGWQAAHLHSPTVGLYNADYVWIHGLYIEGAKGQSNAPSSDHYGQNCLALDQYSERCYIVNNIMTRALHSGIKGGGYCLLEGNVVYDNGQTGLDHGIYTGRPKVVIRGNALFRNAGYGYHGYSNPTDVHVYNNVAFDNGAAGILIAGTRNTVVHNVCTRNSSGTMLFRDGCTYNKFLNNILFSNRNGQITVDKYPSNNTIDYDCVYPKWSSTYVLAKMVGSHMLYADPKVISTSMNDYELQSTSPCIGRATSVTMNGAPASKDIGLFSALSYTEPRW